MVVNSIANVLREGRSFLLMTHKDPDTDAIGSLLALGKALLDAKKEIVLLTEKSVPAVYRFLKGADKIVQGFDSGKDFDAVVALDCSEIERIGCFPGCLEGRRPLINVDHHETNPLFGDLNLVDPHGSSTGELVFNIIKAADFRLNYEIAENIFAAIQADTGSFRYDNTSSKCLAVAAELLDYGVKPWEISRKMMDEYSLSRLRLLEMALGSIEFHHQGKVGMMTISLDMFQKAGACESDSERLVDYPRFVSGVEIAALIRERDKYDYKFSLRSNGRANVAELASRFGGGGHAMAAGFEGHGSISVLKKDLMKEAVRFLDGTPN
ncbi:MAG: bifunctional oligoribonuclease/PAP phosphatase NrnA [Deltaproteobacteria bacterium]|nr:bifunctional oligoribonuclease/PAP phosphatase NrnA [Deltaproteobacteria bacterium]